MYENYDVPDPVDSAQLIIAHAFGKKMVRSLPLNITEDGLSVMRQLFSH